MMHHDSQVVAYLDEQRRLQQRSKGVQSLIVVATIAAMLIACYLAADLETAAKWFFGALIVGAFILGWYRARH